MDGLVFDLEIVKAIPKKGEALVHGVQYCKGWGDHANMGISCLCAYDMVEERMRVFLEDNLDEFFDLCHQRKLLISFNGINFDCKVLKHHGKLPEDAEHYDLLKEVWKSIGKRQKGTGLNAMCEANGLGGKTGNGALAPIQWQKEEFGAVIDYCISDVELTRALFLKSQEGPIKTLAGQTLSLRKVDAI